MRYRFQPLLLVVMAASSTAPVAGAEVTNDPPLQRAADWLVDQQSDDGSWRSETYGLLKSGQAYTPVVLHALLQGRERGFIDVDDHVIHNALQFIRQNLNADGMLGLSDPDIAEYPTYATAYALRCLVLAGTNEDDEHIRRMRQALLHRQFQTANGYGPSHPAHGCWGFGVRPPGATGHVDLAHTRYVLQALDESGRDTAAAERAKAFLDLLQKHPAEQRSQPASLAYPQMPTGTAPYDGGFYFSPVVRGANKGREALFVHEDGSRTPYYRSYATATCDGLLSLLATGATPADEPVRAAIDWLMRHPELDYPAGIPREYPEPWGEAVFFYHLSVRAEAYRAVDMPGAWPNAIHTVLADVQAADGSFRNMASPLMKEDDPLLATTLALTALIHARAGRATVPLR